LVFLLIVLLGALRLAAVRAYAVKQVNQVLQGELSGKLRVEHAEWISLTGVDGVNATVFDPGGRAVLIVRGASARLSIVPLVWAILAHPHASLPIDISHVTADNVEVQLIDDGLGIPTIAAAFAPPHPNQGPSHAPLPTIHIRSIEINHAWVHGRLAPAPAIDADIGHAIAKLELIAARLRLQIDRADVRARDLPNRIDLDGQAGGVMELPVVVQLPGGDSRAHGPVVHAWYSGELASSPIAATFDWVNDKISASFDAQRIEPMSVTRVLPGAHLQHPLSLHAKAEGTLSSIEFNARASVDNEWPWVSAMTTVPATLVINGRAALDDNSEIDAEIRADDVNLAAILADAPESRLGVRANVMVVHPLQGEIAGQYDASTSLGFISGTELPALNLTGDVSQDPTGAVTTKGQAQILESGVRASVSYSAKLGSKASESIVSIESTIEIADPARLRRFANGLSARGSVEVSARYWPDAGHWVAQTHARLHDIQHAQFKVGEIDVRAKAAGGIHAPSGAIQVRARDISVGGQRFPRLDVDADGNQALTRLSAHIERSDAQQFELTTEIGLTPYLRVHHAHLVLPSNEGAVTISVEDIHSHSGTTRIDGLHIEGAGTADASLTIGRELEHLEATTVSLDGVRLARLFGLHSPIKTGRATLVARYAKHGAVAEGSVRGRVVQLSLGPIKDASAIVNLTLAQGKFDGIFAANLAPESVIAVSARALPLSIIERPDSALASREFSLSVKGAMDLEQVQTWTSALGLPLDHASGKVQLDITARGRSVGREYPEIIARVETHSLELTGRRDEQAPIKNAAVARDTQPWSLRGMNGRFDVEISGLRPRVEVSGRLFDKVGTFVDAKAAAELPESFWDTLSLNTTEILRMPVVAKVHMPRRSLRTLPPIFQAQGLRGKALLDIALDGTLENPNLVVDGNVERLSTVTERIAGKVGSNIDISLHADGSRHTGNIRSEAKVRGVTVANLTANWIGDLTRLSSTDLGSRSPLQGDVVVRFDRLPLDALPAIRNQQLSGLLSGQVSLHDWGRNATLVATLDTSQLGLGKVIVERAKITLNGTDGQLSGDVRLSGHNSGTLELEAATPMSWGDRLTPSVDVGVRGTLRAKDFQLAVVSPFLSGSVNELAGLIDATLDATLVDGVPRVEGNASLSQGVIQIPNIGQRFESIGARLTIHDGDLHIDSLEARGLTGRATGSAEAKLHGLSLSSGQVHLAIAQGEQIPITVEGQAIGDAWGRVDVTLNRSADAKSTKIRLDLPEIHLDLPELDPTTLQDLDLAENVRIGTHRSDGQFISLPLQPISNESQVAGEAMLVEMHLGSSVWIQKGREIKVQLGGDLLARMANKTTLEGRLELKAGKFDVSGKVFDIESGVVTFDGGDPGNPSIVATARWDSPTEYRVFAEYAGTVKDGKLTLRSDPPLSSDKVLSLLMFGTPDGSFGAAGTQSQGSESSSVAVGVAGDSAVKGLNRAISGVTKLDVSARLDTSTGTARPELDVQISPRVTARMTRAIGEPAAGQSPDRTFLTFEMRLLRAWALSAVVGDHGGSGLDLLWRRRY
jgi:translocation and assembly module TamB